MLIENILLNKWVFAALAGGLAMLLAIVLVALPFRKPRRGDAAAADAHGSWLATLRHIPLILWLTYVGALAFSIVMVVYFSLRAPNW